MQHDEINRKYIDDPKDNIKTKRPTRYEGKESVRPLSNRATPQPRALERSGDKKGGGRGMGGGSRTSTHTHTHFYKHFAEDCLNEWDGNLASAQDRTPSRGEPQRTPSPKLVGKEDKMKNKDTHRKRNFKRGLRNEATSERRKKNRNKQEITEEHIDKSKAKPPGETGGGWPPKPGDVQHSPLRNSAYKGDYNAQNRSAPTKLIKTRASIIRGMNSTQKIPNKDRTGYQQDEMEIW